MTASVVHDRLAERSVLSAMLWSTLARKVARRHLDREDFWEIANATLWDAMSRMDREKRPVDANTLMTEVRGDKAAVEALIEVMADNAIPDHVDAYAETVRSWAVRRRLASEARAVVQAAENPEVNATGLASAVAAKFAAIRDSGMVEDAASITLDELLASVDDEPDWVIPGLLEHRDRFMLTGSEGLGKSFLLRQLAIYASAGLDPFTLEPIRPAQVLIVDCENSQRQIKRKSRAVVEHARRLGSADPGRVNLLCTGRIDLLRDKDLSAIHREIDAIVPDIIVIGPVYAMSPKALMTDDDAVPVLAALDTMRECGAALLMEAHAGHATNADGRNYRPRGSAALLGWPEFGYGLKPVAQGIADLVPWRGDRDSRNWPSRLSHDRDGIRWVDHEMSTGGWRAS